MQITPYLQKTGQLSSQSRSPVVRLPHEHSTIRTVDKIPLPARTDPAWLWTSSNNETLEISYSEDRRRVFVSVLKNGQPILFKQENLPSRLKSAKNASCISWILVHSYAEVIFLSNGDPKLCLTGKLRGGVSYPEALSMLQQHLMELKNPVVVNELLLKFKQKCEEIWLLREGLGEWFEGLAMPAETKIYIDSLSQAIQNRAKNIIDAEEMNQFTEELNKTLFDLLPDYVPENLWEELKMFWSIKEIRGLGTKELTQLHKEIYSENVSADLLRKKVRQYLSDEVWKEVDRELKSTNLNTLLANISKKRPSKIPSIMDYLKQEMSFFKEKTICLIDPTNRHRLSGNILEAEMQNGSFVFNLDDETKITISPVFTVMVEQIISMDLLKSLFEWMPLKTLFSIENKSECADVVIRPGKYQIINRPEANRVKRQLVLGNQQGKFRYKIVIQYAGEEESLSLSKIWIGSWSPETKSWQKSAEIDASSSDYEMSLFKKNYKVMKTEPVLTSLSGISQSNAHECILIQDKKTGDLANRYLLKIQEDIRQTMTHLITDERTLLNSLVDNWIDNGLKEVDCSLIAGTPLFEEINAISNKYKKLLDIDKPFREILLPIVKEANYSTFINKESSIQTARAMELLKDAFLHAKGLNKKNAILFLGNTGSGKSTSICYLLGAPLRPFTNKVGDEVYKLGWKKPLFAVPEIGQAIGTSETLYAQGYQIPKTLNWISDCAGFGDTRGGDYELCAYLSMDLVMRELEKIQALVIAVPHKAFILDRGNKIIELAYAIQERFPHVFEEDHPDQKRFFLLVTKTGAKGSGQSDLLGDQLQKRLQVLYQEESAIVAELMAREPAQARPGKLSKSNFRLKVWTCLNRMWNKKQISLLDPQQAVKRQELIKQYFAPVDGEPIVYKEVMKNKNIQRQFRKILLLTTHTWVKVIFKQYLGTIVDEIAELNERLLIQKSELGALEEEIATRTAIIDSQGVDMVELEECVAQLEEGIMTLEELKLKPGVEKICGSALSDVSQMAIDQNRKDFEDRLKVLAQVTQDIENRSRLISVMNARVQELEAELCNLSQGEHLENLWEVKPQLEDQLHYRKSSFFNSNKVAVDAAKAAKSVPAKDFKGDLYYRPAVETGGYEVDISGHHYEIKGSKPAVKGKVIKYSIKTSWQEASQIQTFR